MPQWNHLELEPVLLQSMFKTYEGLLHRTSVSSLCGRVPEVDLRFMVGGMTMIERSRESRVGSESTNGRVDDVVVISFHHAS